MSEYERRYAASHELSSSGIPDLEFEDGSVEDQISDFLDGRTHGEELFHALYDHVLDEPVPERLRALFES
jgi:hypothetical protein